MVLGELAGGVYDGLRGALYLVSHPRLWLYVLLPMIAAILILVTVAGSAMSMLSAPLDALASHLPAATYCNPASDFL